MLKRRIGLLVACAAATVVTSSALADEHNVALKGYCPVCLVKAGKLVEGDPNISSVYDSKTYLFPNEEQKRVFEASPEAFVPALGGNCTVCKVEKNKDVPGLAKFHTVRDGRLYLFPSEKQQRMFDRKPDKYVSADLAMGGACPVCLKKKGKVVPGKEEYASIYDGQRYLFPGPEQKQMFDSNPRTFAPAMGGKCTVCKVEKNKDVVGDAKFHTTHQGRLYLFPSEKQLGMFEQNPARYANADVAMKGYCAVCKVEMNKDVRGKKDISVDYNGRRFLFPGVKQRDMFLANPDKYAGL